MLREHVKCWYCVTMTQRENEWAAAWSTGIGQRIGAERRKAGLTGDQLAERTGELGYLIPRATIANIESGRREQVSVQEVAVLAAALGVPPTVLVFDVAAAEVELMPGRVEPGIAAAEWWAGNKAGNLRSQVPLDRQAEALPSSLTLTRQAARLQMAFLRAWKEYERLGNLHQAGDPDLTLDLEWDNARSAVQNAATHLIDAYGGIDAVPDLPKHFIDKMTAQGLAVPPGR